MNISSCWAASPLVCSISDIDGLDYCSTGYTVVSRSTRWGHSLRSQWNGTHEQDSTDRKM